MTVDAKSKNGKAQKAISQIMDGDDSGLFYINENAKKAHDREHNPKIEKMQFLKTVWEQKTGERITSYEQFIELYQGPEAYFKKLKAADNVEKKKPMTLALIGEGYSLEVIEQIIKLPEGFSEVTEAWKRLQREKFSLENYSYDGTNFTLSSRYANRLTNKIYYHAVTKLQKKRLELANKFVELYSEMAELLRMEAEEVEIKDAKIQKCINSKMFAGALPYCVRLDGFRSIFNEQDTKIDVVPSEEWVVSGFRMYAGQIGMPELHPIVDAPKYFDRTIYKRYWRTELDGERRPRYVKAGDENLAYRGIAGREGRVSFDKENFRLSNGRFVMID